MKKLIVLIFAVLMLVMPATAGAATYGPRDLSIPGDFATPWDDGWNQACESIYVAERLRLSPTGKSHLDVCVIKPRTIHFVMANGNIFKWGEVLYPDEANLVFKRVRGKLTNPDNFQGHLIKVMAPNNAGGLVEVDVRNIADINVFRTPNAQMEFANAPYIPAFFGGRLFVNRIGVDDD